MDIGYNQTFEFIDTFFLDDDEVNLKVLRRRSMPVSPREVVQISLVVFREILDEVFTTFLVEKLAGEDEVVMECFTASEKQIQEDYPWYFN